MAESVVVREVGLRDGLQLVKEFIPTEIKIEWCRQQAAAGFSEMEVTSFVPPKLVPQLADAATVLQASSAIPGLTPAVLVPNLKGGLRAMQSGARVIQFVLSVSEAHNQSNVRRSTQESINDFAALICQAKELGLNDDVHFIAGLATAFGCSIQGDVAHSDVFKVAEQMIDHGANEIMIADTVGYGNPKQVKQLFADLKKYTGDIPVLAHFHDTRGMGLSNVVAAIESGVHRFDAALGGLGGCPFAPGATGNIATEDCVYLLENLGLDTGIDLSHLLQVRKQLDLWVPSAQKEGRLAKAGVAKNFVPAIDLST